MFVWHEPASRDGGPKTNAENTCTDLVQTKRAPWRASSTRNFNRVKCEANHDPSPGDGPQNPSKSWILFFGGCLIVLNLVVLYMLFRL
jgi:hypothetical protein